MKTRTLIGLLGAGLVLAGSPDYSYGQRSPGSIYLDQAMKDVPPNARVGFQLQQSAMDGAYQQRLMREELEEDHQRQKAEQRRAEQQRAEQNRRQQFFAEQRRRQQDQDLEVYAMNRWIDINHDGVFDPGEDQGRKDFYEEGEQIMLVVNNKSNVKKDARTIVYGPSGQVLYSNSSEIPPRTVLGASQGNWEKCFKSIFERGGSGSYKWVVCYDSNKIKVYDFEVRRKQGIVRDAVTGEILR